MLDQSFSPDNFRTVMQVLNRKGIYIEEYDKFKIDVFAASRSESNKILAINKKIKTERKRLLDSAKTTDSKFDYNAYQVYKDSFADTKNQIKQFREEILTEILEKISVNINQVSYKVGVNKGTVKWGKQLYVDNNTVEDFFVLKQIQYNLKRSFKVQPANRSLIISRLITFLNDKFPKVILRADISSFYESIKHDTLIERLNNNNVLSSPSKRIIKETLNKYWQILLSDGLKLITDEREGIPRGMGISAYLSEIYMRDFDNAVMAIPNVTYYSRYVDDIMIIFTPNSRYEAKTLAEYTESIRKLLHQKTRLNLNLDKTEIVDLRPTVGSIKQPVVWCFTFLGYKFSFEYKLTDVVKDGKITKVIRLEPLSVRMSDTRRKRYANRIKMAFKAHSVGKYLKKSNRLLIKRLMYLTGNTKLIGNKSNVFVGIYFSNTELSTPYNDLLFLNRILKIKINSLPTSDTYLKSRLIKFDFQAGFEKKVFNEYSLSKLSEILIIWK